MWCMDVPENRQQAREAFSSLEAVWALEGDVVTQSALCEVSRVELDGRGYYLKRYHKAADHWVGGYIKSKGRREWENLLRFRDWGLPVASVVAYGEEPSRGHHRRAVLVTEEVAGSRDLAWLESHQSPLLDNPHWVSKVSQQVAAATRVMHEHNFAHNDWKWRNILVSGSDEDPKITMIDCPSGMFWWGPFFEYRRIKDIACLDKIGKRVLSPKQRLKFYREYRKLARLTAVDKRDIRRVLSFFKGRE